MLNLRRKRSVRISDHLAMTAALLLTLTAAGGVLADRFMGPGDAPATAMPAATGTADPTSDDAEPTPHGLNVRVLLFRHG